MKRSGFKQRAPLRATAPAKAEVPTARCKAKGCRARFVRLSKGHRACSVEHARLVVAQDKAEKARKEARELKTAKDDAKPLGHWLKLTEAVVNAFVLQRDRERPCISCGTFKTVQWEAGHYRNVGSYPEIRFDLRNITKQCHRCNCDLHGNKDNYRIGYVERNGQEPMDWLEGPHPTANYTREGLAQLRAEVRRLGREMKEKA